MRKHIFAVPLLCLFALSTAQAGQVSANTAWNSVWAPSTPNDLSLINNQALLEWQLRNGITNPGGSNLTNYNGTINQTYTGPVSNSGSSVTNVGNLSTTSVVTNANGGSNVTVGTSASQQANGAAQSGAANSKSTTGNAVYDASNTITSSNNH
ncbi:MAG TPA: hypothetical protein VN665_00130 [Candidatus Paceibacterota bacterium]|nr:hypothetical protein [Candidatus Paceibacterota bacterium]